MRCRVAYDRLSSNYSVKESFPRKNLLVVMIFLLASKEYVTEKKKDCSQQSNKTNRSCRLVLVIALSALRFLFIFHLLAFFLSVSLLF
jgi:archaellum biogenesis protein FlaJ (TadC family)